MRLTRFSDIGLRVLIYLHEGHTRPNPVTVAEIATQFDLPLNHVVKVAGQLARLGWVQAVRGRNGGLRLALEPAAIGVGTVLRQLEGDTELIDCDGSGCQLAGACSLRSALAEGMRAFYAALDRYTLADLAGGSTGAQVLAMHRMFLDRLGPPGQAA
jgi:Rrf2 family nitric oxide-sensitive transcriptional repressor